ncbi:MAG TPA: O-antigen ligase family protein [Acidimicrobiales bacterium]|nr:O-antigen ligase family protein [Acidimicrobiales bacterium]
MSTVGLSTATGGAAPVPPVISAPRWRVPAWIWLLAGVGGAAGLAGAVALHRTPLLALGGAAGLVVAALALVRPLFALVLLQVVTWSNISSVVGTHGGISPYLVAIALALLSVAIEARRRGRLVFGRSPLYRLLALVMAAEGVSLIFSSHPLSLTLTTSRLKDLVFFICTVALIGSTDRPVTAIKAMVVTIAILCGLTVVQQYGLHNATSFGGLSQVHAADIGSTTSRHTGPESDPNFWGRTIVLVAPLALSVLLTRVRAGRRWWPWALAGLALAGGEYLSQSRGGLIAFVIGVVVWAVVALWARRKWFWLAPAAVAVVLMLAPSLGSRLSTVGQLSNVSVGSTDPSLVDRIQVQQVGLAIFRQHPLTGVGLGNFEVVEPSYLGQPGIIDTGTVFAPHDLYLQIASEQGLVGLGAWALFYGGALVVGCRAVLLARRLGRDEDALMALGAVAGLVGWAAASAALHLSDFNELLSVLALVAVLDHQLRRRLATTPLPHRPGPSEPERRRAARLRRANAITTTSALAMGAVALVGVGTLVPLHGQAWKAQATSGVRPQPAAVSGFDAYAWDVINRQPLIPTFVAIISDHRFTDQALAAAGPGRHPGVSFAASGNSSAAVVTMSVTAPDPALARQLAGDTLSAARAYISRHVSLYQLDPVSTSPAVRVSRRRSSGELALLATVVAALAAAAGAAALNRRRVSRDGADREEPWVAGS